MWTMGYVIRYEGTLSFEQGTWIMKGTWINEKGGSHGTFACAKEL